LGCGNAVTVTGSKCGRCIREAVERGRAAVDYARHEQLQRGLAQVRAALSEARGQP
jgi:hypothetical protein